METQRYLTVSPSGELAALTLSLSPVPASALPNIVPAFQSMRLPSPHPNYFQYVSHDPNSSTNITTFVVFDSFPVSGGFSLAPDGKSLQPIMGLGTGVTLPDNPKMTPPECTRFVLVLVSSPNMSLAEERQPSLTVGPEDFYFLLLPTASFNERYPDRGEEKTFWHAMLPNIWPNGGICFGGQNLGRPNHMFTYVQAGLTCWSEGTMNGDLLSHNNISFEDQCSLMVFDLEDLSHQRNDDLWESKTSPIPNPVQALRNEPINEGIFNELRLAPAYDLGRGI